MKLRDVTRRVKPPRRVAGFLSDFKDFAMKGNVLDLAVGVIIGGAFGKITSSLVSDVVMPLMGLLLGGVDLTKWELALPAVREGAEPAAIKFGVFLQTVVDFTIMAFCVFVFTRLFGAFKRKKEETPAPAPEAGEDVALLREIRDLLREGRGK